jgi:predicted transposase/invertase (TIGR01784 family)
MEIHTLELRKLPDSPGADDKESELLNWLRLIRSEREEEIDMLATKTPEMKKAVKRLKQLSADERTQMICEARELAIMDEMARIEAAQAEGKAIGEAIGEARGEVRGERKKAEEVAREMLDNGLEIELISKISGLSPEEINALG